MKESQDLLSDNFRIGYLEEYAGQSSIFTTETLDYHLTTIQLTNGKTDCISHQVLTKCEIHLIEMNGSAWKCSKSTDFTLETEAEWHHGSRVEQFDLACYNLTNNCSHQEWLSTEPCNTTENMYQYTMYNGLV